ncbi:MAG: hypothetical protein MUP81_01395 [Dehalococcoidia bacterium]|nr:hypothetical protein [Dehalococcoidia bacterium]
MRRKDFTTILLVTRLPNKPERRDSSYSKGDVKRQWGNEILKKVLANKEYQIGYYEWLKLETQ